MRAMNPIRGYLYPWGEICLDCWEASVMDGATVDGGKPVYQDGSGARHLCVACGDVYMGPTYHEDFERWGRHEGSTDA